MRVNRACLMALVALVALMVACAPQAAPAPAAPAAPAPAPAAPALSPEEAAWAGVVAAAKKEGMLTIYASSSFSAPSGPLAQAFRDQYGIKVEIMIGTGRGNNERVKVEQAMKRPVASIMQAGLSSLVEVMNAGLAQNVWRDLPSFRDKSVFSVDPVYSPDGSILSIAFNFFGPLINTNLVKPQDEPRSYYDLLDPKWKGKLILEDPRGGGGSGFAWWAGMRYFNILDDDYWRKLASQTQLWGASPAAMYQMVARGEYPIAVATASYSVAPIIAEGAPVRQLEMKEGTYGQTGNIGALANMSHPNAAKLFLNWLFSKEGLTVYARAAQTRSVRKDVPDFSIPGTIGTPQKLVFNDWASSEAFAKYRQEGIAEKLFGKK